MLACWCEHKVNTLTEQLSQLQTVFFPLLRRNNELLARLSVTCPFMSEMSAKTRTLFGIIETLCVVKTSSTPYLSNVTWTVLCDIEHESDITSVTCNSTIKWSGSLVFCAQDFSTIMERLFFFFHCSLLPWKALCDLAWRQPHMNEKRAKERMRAAPQMKYLPLKKCIAELKSFPVSSQYFFWRGTGALAFRCAARFMPLVKGKW